jgi:hypothetical protein
VYEVVYTGYVGQYETDVSSNRIHVDPLRAVSASAPGMGAGMGVARGGGTAGRMGRGR